jgi:hypothetical protein
VSPGSLRLLAGSGLAAAALVAAAAGPAAWPVVPAVRHLVVEDAATGRVLHREPVRPGDTFALAYVHSSEHVPVRGVFRVGPDGSFTVVETAFGGFGPGLPELRPGDDWLIRDGMIVARGSDVRMQELALRVSPITHHRLTTPGGVGLDLSDRLGAAGRVRVRAN